MSEFKREPRYYVFKISKLDPETDNELFNLVQELGQEASIECAVVESDWPNYEDTWTDIEAVANGTYSRQAINKVKAEGVRLFGKECASHGPFGNVFSGLADEYASKLEKGDA